MPKSPKGEKRPADVIGNAVHVMRIARGAFKGRYSPAQCIGAEKHRVEGSRSEGREHVLVEPQNLTMQMQMGGSRG